jgi:2-polyprenyl-6-methoxyphenol hydroxylase-like FAD-dependent oxidoreductase
MARRMRRPNSAIGVSRFTEATLHQGYIEDALLSSLQAYPQVQLLRNARPLSSNITPAQSEVGLRADVDVEIYVEAAEPHIVSCRAKILIGCDGAHSWTRKQSGILFEGPRTGSLWGVMDIVPITDFRRSLASPCDTLRCKLIYQ